MAETVELVVRSCSGIRPRGSRLARVSRSTLTPLASRGLDPLVPDSALVDRLLAARDGCAFWRVGVDGVDGAGKTWFAGELAYNLDRRGVPTVRVTLDGFRTLALDPLSTSGSGVYVPTIHDVMEERPVRASPLGARPESAVIVDGIFLHRDEIVSYWNYSIWLQVPFEVSTPRGAGRGYGNADPAHTSNHRYAEGQRLYIADCAPRQGHGLRRHSDLDDPDFLRFSLRCASVLTPMLAHSPAS